MKITNKVSYPVIAFSVYTKVGYGDDVVGESKEAEGLYLGEMDGESCHTHIDGEIVC
jgi:hypothetical protein